MSSPLPPPHVVFFPFPAQGHVNSMLKLAELMILSLPSDLEIRATFVNTEHNHHRLLQCSDVASRFASHPTFRFKTISDGLPLELPRTEEQLLKMFEYLKLTARDVVREVTVPGTCIIADGFLNFLINAGEETGTPVVMFHAIGACAFWTYFCIPRLIEAGELPIRGNEELNRTITTIPGMEGRLRCRDLPPLWRVANPFDSLLDFGTTQIRDAPKARGLIINTFDALEGPILGHIQAHCHNIYTVGPLNAHLRSRLLATKAASRYFLNSLLEEDRSCLEWLDKQPPRSVVYVSFGSIAVLKGEELMEYEIVAELKASTITMDRGCIVDWAPQEEVLAHPAIGGFLTHSGWNSTMESITAGVPMLCWPYFADQHPNSRFVSEFLGVGLDMKDMCDRTIVERMINDLMVDKRDELQSSAAEKVRLAREAVIEGGSSWVNLDSLIEDIRKMTVGKQ
ncbi:hypothetical protein CDL15_Pgr013418 [Punica granatum]|uniref:Glycosyltransferase n=1 Tax=Punica granatum TaxID=22663 RepID=A0A218W1Q5_PUNGR|nr:hypothetical protein CDL15_Pgr013418 [Punica granatum]